VRLTLLLTIVLLAAGCGGGEPSSDDAAPGTTAAPAGPRALATSQTATVLERQYGADADGFYLFTPRKGPWKQVVVFVHGHGDESEITPVHHRPWLRHLVERGSAVVYPRYEEQPGGHGAAKHIDKAVRSALEVLDEETPRIVGIGYSRGGRLVVDWAAITAQETKPRALLAVFPASAEEPSPDLSQVDPFTRVLVLSGDQDEVVGPYGAADLLLALKNAGFHLRRAKWRVVESSPDFTVNHLSVLDSSPAARKRFWRPADRLIAQVG
jgi:pimeloyl-ACP methyl ester carboxylesterase